MEDESMEGKDLALEEKMKEFELNILEIIEDLKEGESTTSIEGLRITKSKDNYMLELKDITFGILDKDGNFTYNKSGLKEIKKALAEEDMTLEDLGLPDIEKAIDQREQEEQQKDEKEREEKDLSEDKEEEEKDEPKEEEKTEDEEEKEIESKNRPENLKKLNSNIMKLLAPSARAYGNIYLNSEGEIVGYNKSTKQIEPVKGISRIKGNSANKQIHGTENDKHQHVNASILYQIDSRPNTGFAVTIDGTENGNRDLKYTMRRVGSNSIEDFAYADIPLLASQRREGVGRAKTESGIREGTRGQGERDQVLDEKDELDEEIEIPEDMAKKFDDKMNSVPIKTMKEFKDELTKLVKEKLDKERPNDFPDSHTRQAKVIVDDMVDENVDYEKAKDDLYEGKNKNEKERGDDDGEKLPGDNPLSRR